MHSQCQPKASRLFRSAAALQRVTCTRWTDAQKLKRHLNMLKYNRAMNLSIEELRQQATSDASSWHLVASRRTRFTDRRIYHELLHSAAEAMRCRSRYPNGDRSVDEPEFQAGSADPATKDLPDWLRIASLAVEGPSRFAICSEFRGAPGPSCPCYRETNTSLTAARPHRAYCLAYIAGFQNHHPLCLSESQRIFDVVLLETLSSFVCTTADTTHRANQNRPFRSRRDMWLSEWLTRPFDGRLGRTLLAAHTV